MKQATTSQSHHGGEIRSLSIGCRYSLTPFPVTIRRGSQSVTLVTRLLCGAKSIQCSSKEVSAKTRMRGGDSGNAVNGSEGAVQDPPVGMSTSEDFKRLGYCLNGFPDKKSQDGKPEITTMKYQPVQKFMECITAGSMFGQVPQ